MQAARKYFNTYIHTYTLFKLEIQCSCRANIFEKKKIVRSGGNITVKSAESLPFFWAIMRTSACFRRKLKKISPPPFTYFSFNNKKIRNRVDSRVQLVWRLRVMGSWILSVKKREYLKPTYIWLSYHIRLLYLGSRSFMNKLDLSKAIKEVQEVKTNLEFAGVHMYTACTCICIQFCTFLVC